VAYHDVSKFVFRRRIVRLSQKVDIILSNMAKVNVAIK
jgi:hypothetical protein